jgi:hypothetical protein
MKRYLVYYDKSPEGGIDAMDYLSALNKARRIALFHNVDRKHIRIRFAREGTLLAALARQKDFGK